MDTRKRIIKRIIAMLLAFVLLGAMTACGDDDEDDGGKKKDKKASDTTSSLKIGDTYTFGSYYQGDIFDISNYKSEVASPSEKEPIKWIVIDKKDDAYLLLSLYGLDCRPYNAKKNGSKASTWETCDLRKWLNEDFLNTAFSSEEQQLIRETDIKTPEGLDRCYMFWGEITDTKDKVFVLGLHEVLYYCCNGAITEDTFYCYFTRYARNNGAIAEIELSGLDRSKFYGAWLTRTPKDDNEILYVLSDRLSWESNVDMDETGLLIRPAIWITID